MAVNIDEYSLKLGISKEFAELLLARGLDNVEDASKFLHPSFDDMSNPFDIKGMKEAVERIKTAISKKERILIFGDYDCDGISAISILMLYLENKTSVDFYIPDRNEDGYGLSSHAIENLFKENKPNLVITVDCGITSVKEIESLKEVGIDVIVTDHHEPQDEIPDCIVVDPKIEKKGFYDFCGAGVALKLVEALSNREEIKKYLDICAIATIADVVPLVGENRIIAAYGLEKIRTNTRMGLKIMLGGKEITSYDVMYKIAPRINSAGRLGSAKKVVDLFISKDPILLTMLCDELEADNTRRQAICEQVVSEAREMLKDVDFNKTRIIILENDNWEAGVIGIAAARLVDDFKRPTILLTKKEDGLIGGSSRSIQSVNIFELLMELSDCFVTFGGHAQAAGITMEQSKLADFKKRANDILLKEHDVSEFVTKFKYDAELNIEKPLLGFATELELLEPTGFGNPKPVFRVIESGMYFERMSTTSHIKYVNDNIEIVGFNCLDKIGSFTGEVELELTLEKKIFQNREYAQGTLKSVKVNKIDISDNDAYEYNIHQLSYEKKAPSIPVISNGAVNEFLEKPYGTLFLCFNESEYRNLLKEIPQTATYNVSVGTPVSPNPENSVLICPSKEVEFAYFERIIVAGKPLCDAYLAHLQTQCKDVYALDNIGAEKVYIPDEVINKVFYALHSIFREFYKPKSEKQMYAQVQKSVNINKLDFDIIIQIFYELGILEIKEKRLGFNYIKTDRNRSNTYRNTRG